MIAYAKRMVGQASSLSRNCKSATRRLMAATTIVRSCHELVVALNSGQAGSLSYRSWSDIDQRGWLRLESFPPMIAHPPSTILHPLIP